MSLLAQQLGQLSAQSAIKIAPGAPKPTLILDQNTARNTTIDVLYTMALMGYNDLKKSLAVGAKELGEVLLSTDYKEMNRNKLGQQENKDLSVKLTRFLLLLSPWFLNRGCQAVIEYLLRNFSIHIFESEQVILLFLQYWQNEAYSKMIKNVEIKKPHLSFVKQIQEGKSINLTYIVKSLTYSRSLLESLIMFTKRYIRQEGQTSQEVELNLVSLATNPTNFRLPVQVSALVKHDPKQFLLQILGELLNRKINTFNKEICEFCVSTSKEEDEQVRSMSMMLTISILSNEPTHNLWIHRVFKNLMKCDDMEESMFKFIMVIWQRWPKLINRELIQQLIEKQGFVSMMNSFAKSVYMPFYMLFECYFEPKFPHKGILGQILEICVLKVKEQAFVRAHQNVYFNQLLSIFQQNISSLDKQEAKFIKAFIKNSLQYEYAVYIDSQKYQPVAGILPENCYKNGILDFSLVNLKRMEIEQKIQNLSIQNEEEESEDEMKAEVVQHDNLLKIINSRSKRDYATLDISNPEINAIALLLLQGFYKKEETILIEQKNRLLEFPSLFSTYTVENFSVDMNAHDYSTALRFVMKDGNIEMYYDILSRVVTDEEAAGDLLFRELCRQVIEKIAIMAKVNYKAVVNMLSRLYQFYNKNQNPELTKQINELMLKLSESVVRNGKLQGKFHKMIASHAKMLANLTLSKAHREQYALFTYSKLLHIFGSENTYFILVGVIQILALKQKNNKQFGSFIEIILIPSLRSQEESFIRYYHFLQAISKLLVFTYYMLREGTKIEADSDEIIEQMSFGVAKKLITSFFGLISAKNKRNISRKIFMFLAVLFKSAEHSLIFQQMLSSITRKQQLKIAAICSKIYSVLTTIFTISEGPLKQSAEQAKSKLVQLFPLQLKIYVLGPLLPLDEVYKELGKELQIHSHKKFDSLTHFVNILPNSLTSNWLKFMSESMKRNFTPSTQIVKSILSGQIQNQENSLVEFICSFTQFGKEQALEVLEEIMEIIFNQCNEPSEYSLAVIYSLIKNLKEYAEPYIDKMFKIAIEVEAEQMQQFLEGISQILTPPTLLNLVKKNWKSVQNLRNFTLFLNQIGEIVTFESIWKTTQNFFARSLNTLVEREESYESLHLIQAEVFVKLSMKMNDSQLRTILIDYVRWSSEKTNSDSSSRLVFNSRKNLLMNIYEALSNKLGELFSHFYGYIFENITKDLQGMLIHKDAQSGKSIGKRDRNLTDFSLSCSFLYSKSMLRALMGLFRNDPENEFMDSVKFDLLGPRIGHLFDITGLGEFYPTFISEYLQPCLICLYKHTVDDYKLKSLNTQILRLLKTKDQKIIASIYGFYELVIDHVEHRFLLFVDELIPLLVEASNSRNQAVRKSVENIIYKVQNLSGQKIQNYIR